MTEVTLRITADARRAVDGINQVDRALDGISDSAPGAARAVNQVGESAQRVGREAADGFGDATTALAGLRAQVLGLVAGAASIGTVLSVAGIADEYAAVSARLKNAVGDSMSLAAAQDAVFAVAQRTRSNLAATGDLVSGLARAYKAAGMDAEQAFGTSLRLSEAINNALTASGTSAAAASGLITQLNQALSSGVLRGDEFNSMMEASPRLAQALAAGLNVPIGRLREMAEAGELTRDRVTAALTGVEWDKLAAEAAAMPLSLAQGWQQVTNAFQQYVGRANAEAGATSSVAAALGLLADNLDDVLDSILRLGTAIAAGLGARALIPVFGAMAAQLTVAGSAALGAATALTGLKAALTGVLAVGLAGVAGWQVGKWLKEQFVEVEVAGIDMVAGVMYAFETLKSGAQLVGSTIEIAFGNAINRSKMLIADLLNAFLGFSQIELPAGLRADFTFGAADKIKALSAEISAGIGPIREYEGTWKEIGATFATNRDAVTNIRNEMVDFAYSSRVAGEETEKTTAALGAQTPTAKEAADATGQLAEAQREAAESTRLHAEAMGELRDAGSEFERLRDRIADAMATPAERARREYERMIAVIDRYEAALPNLGAVDPAELARIQQLRADVERVYQASIDGSKEAAEANKRAAEESERYWGGFGDAISNALGDGLVNGFKGTADRLKNIFKRLLADLATAAISQRIVIPIMTALGLPTGGMQTGNLLQTILGGGGQGGGGGLLSSLFGGGQSAGFVGPPAPAGMGNAGGPLQAIMSMFGNGGAAGGPIAIAMAAAAVQSVLGARLARALGGNERGGQIGGILAGIPGAIIGGAFGSSFRPTGVRGTNFSFGADAATGTAFEEQSRVRSLYRGRRFRTVESALGEDAQQQIDAVFRAVGDAMAQAAAQLGTDIPPRITASFRATTDAQGNVISEVGTILGRQYTESFETFSRRIASENVIGVLDSALDGEAGRIAEAWRSDAELLADGAGMLLAAATDIRRGAGLLGDGSLTQVAELIGELQADGETLAATYARVSGATQLLEQAVELSGLALDKSREDFVRFATGIVEEAGGLERANALFADFYRRFYTDAERAALTAQRAREAAEREFADIGLNVTDFTGATGLADFRRQFEQILTTGSAEAVAQWLEAANALGILVDATAQLGDQAITTAETLRDFLAGIDAELAGNASPVGVGEQLEQQRQRNAELIARAQELGASEAELARVRQLGQQRIDAIIQGVAPQTATLTAALRRLGIAATGTAEDIAVAAAGLSQDFGTLFAEFESTFFTPAEQSAFRAGLAQSQLTQALQAAGLATDALISRQELRARIEAALAAGNFALAESLLRVASAMNQLDDAAGNAASSTQQLINNGNGNQFGSGNNGTGLGFGDPGGGNSGSGGLGNDIDEIRRALRDWLTSLTTGELSPERPRDRLRRAQAEFDRLYALAQAGDADAMRQLQQAGENVLRLGRQVFASGQGYTDLYNAIIGRVGAIAGGGSGGVGIDPTDGIGRLGDAAGIAAEALRGLAGQIGLPSAGLLTDFGTQVAATAVDGLLSQIRATQPPPTQQQDTAAPVVAAIDRAGAATVQRLAELTRRMEQLEAATTDAARQQIRAVDRQTDTLKVTR